jgi:hypothetical protein
MVKMFIKRLAQTFIAVRNLCILFENLFNQVKKSMNQVKGSFAANQNNLIMRVFLLQMCHWLSILDLETQLFASFYRNVICI